MAAEISTVNLRHSSQSAVIRDQSILNVLRKLMMDYEQNLHSETGEETALSMDGLLDFYRPHDASRQVIPYANGDSGAFQKDQYQAACNSRILLRR